MVGAVVLLAFAAFEQISFRTLLDGQLGSVHPFLGGCHPHHLQLLIVRAEVVSSNYQGKRAGANTPKYRGKAGDPLRAEVHQPQYKSE